MFHSNFKFKLKKEMFCHMLKLLGRNACYYYVSFMHFLLEYSKKTSNGLLINE